MVTPRFSIITVTYNAVDVLEVTIQSVISQTYPNIEYIIVDGASTDGTLNLIHSYREQINSFVSEPDKGLYDAMNKAIEMASGDYLCFLNAGDTLYENTTLEKVITSINKNKGQFLPDIIYGETAIVNNKREFLHLRRLAAPEQLTWKSFKQGMLVCHQSFWVKRALAEPYDLSYCFSSDFDWCIRMLKKAKRIHNSHLVLVNFLEGGMTKKNHRASLKERFRIMATYYGWVSTLFYHVWFVVRLMIKPQK